ncbi:MAG: amidohydrolase family protein [Candidatus Altiarchaeota archaeon]|nr:amidohydrolase family protein [Candidatus Altiarchaeota archaeon]
MIINSSILANEKFTFIEEGHIIIENGVITEVGDGFLHEGINAKEYIVIPGLINAHTHIGDSFAKEAVQGLGVGDAVGKTGMKWTLYKDTDENTIINSMQDSVKYMLNSGITTFADFREFGLEGINQLKNAVKTTSIKAIILGRDLGNNLDCCDGLGLNLYQLDQIPVNRKKKIIALHAGEACGEVEAALKHDPDIIVHFTHCTKNDVKDASTKKTSVILCPRCNAALGAGFPPVKDLLDEGINIALGTDNVMINSPDLFREMEFLLKYSHLNGGVEPEDVLKMATVNAAKALKTNSGVILRDKAADLIFIDKNAPNLRHTSNLIATIVSRCQAENVRKIMVAGVFVINKDSRY